MGYGCQLRSLTRQKVKKGMQISTKRKLNAK